MCIYIYIYTYIIACKEPRAVLPAKSLGIRGLGPGGLFMLKG